MFAVFVEYVLLRSVGDAYGMSEEHVLKLAGVFDTLDEAENRVNELRNGDESLRSQGDRVRDYYAWFDSIEKGPCNVTLYRGQSEYFE